MHTFSFRWNARENGENSVHFTVHAVFHAGGYPGNVLYLLLFKLDVGVKAAVVKLALKSYLQGPDSEAKKSVVDVLESSGVRGSGV